jgi:hypothetical protein
MSIWLLCIAGATENGEKCCQIFFEVRKNSLPPAKSSTAIFGRSSMLEEQNPRGNAARFTTYSDYGTQI